MISWTKAKINSNLVSVMVLKEISIPRNNNYPYSITSFKQKLSNQNIYRSVEESWVFFFWALTLACNSLAEYISINYKFKGKNSKQELTYCHKYVHLLDNILLFVGHFAYSKYQPKEQRQSESTCFKVNSCLKQTFNIQSLIFTAICNEEVSGLSAPKL